MYKDEFRPAELTERQHFAFAMSNPAGSFADILRPTGSQQQEEFQRILRELAATKTALTAKERELRTARDRINRANREKKLAEQRLHSLRNSTTMKVGRTLVRPLQTAKIIATEPSKVPGVAKRSLGRFARTVESHLRNIASKNSSSLNAAKRNVGEERL